MLFVYPAIFHKESDTYWVEFPDLEGCQSYGDTINDTMESAQEALYGYLLTLFEDNTTIATPSDISKFEVSENSFLSYVLCDINQCRESKSVKKTLTIPSWLNDRSVAMGINFSKVLQDALLNKIQTK